MNLFFRSFFLLFLSIDVSLAMTPKSCFAQMKEGDSGGGAKPLSTLKGGETIVGFYRCNSCGKENSARPNVHGVQQCGGCGKAHEGKSLDFYPVSQGKGGFTEDQRVGVDPKKKDNEKNFGKGKKKTCPFCGTSNFRNRHTCSQCGADIKDAKDIGHRNPEPASTTRAQSHTLRNTAIAGAALLLGGGGVYLFNSTDNYEGELESKRWSHSELVQSFVKITSSDWRENIYESQAIMPVNGSGERAGAFNIRNCRDEFHHNDQIQVGENVTTIPGAVVNNGDGTFTKEPDTEVRTPIYQDKPVYKEKCDYDTYVWQDKTSDERAGVNPESGVTSLPWPNLPLGKYDRVIKSASYKLKFKYNRDGKLDSYEGLAKDQADFLSWNLGEAVMVERRKIGLIKDVKRLNDIPVEKEN